jgi:hypothetical protein
MKNTIEETTRLLLQGTLTKDEADKILLSLSNVIKSVCKHEYITDADWKSLTCRLCNDRIKPTQTVL